jgi:hypothetical protein
LSQILDFGFRRNDNRMPSLLVHHSSRVEEKGWPERFSPFFAVRRRDILTNWGELCCLMPDLTGGAGNDLHSLALTVGFPPQLVSSSQGIASVNAL